MAKRLQDDHLRFIVDVEAKGVQAEIQSIAKSTLELGAANKDLKEKIKTAKEELKTFEKQMRLAKKEADPDRYHEMGMAYANSQAKLERLNKELTINMNKLDDNKKKTTEIIQVMKVQDMTMSQLRQKAAQLRGQLNNTAQATSPEAYAQLEKELGEVSDRMDQL